MHFLRLDGPYSTACLYIFFFHSSFYFIVFSSFVLCFIYASFMLQSFLILIFFFFRFVFSHLYFIFSPTLPSFVSSYVRFSYVPLSFFPYFLHSFFLYSLFSVLFTTLCLWYLFLSPFLCFPLRSLASYTHPLCSSCKYFFIFQTCSVRHRPWSAPAQFKPVFDVHSACSF
jgi:hypothetical protein